MVCKLFKNKKGSEFDIIFIMSVVLVMGVGMLFATKVFDEFKFNAEDMLNSSAAGRAVFNTGTNRVVPLFDNVFVAIFGGLSFISIVSALFIRTHPVFFIVSILLLSIALVLAALYSNVSETFTDGALSKYKSLSFTFPKMNFIMDNLPYIVLGISILLLVVLYSFGRQQVFG